MGKARNKKPCLIFFLDNPITLTYTYTDNSYLHDRSQDVPDGVLTFFVFEVVKMEKIVLPIELYSSKNSRQIFRTKSGRTIIAKSNASKQNERDLCFLLNIYRKEWERLCTGKKYPLKVHLFIYRKTKRRFDYVNLVQNLFDCMQMAEWLPDDDADHLIPVFDGYSVDKDNPRVEISIE